MPVRSKFLLFAAWARLLSGIAVVAIATASTSADDPFRPDAQPESPFALREWVDSSGGSKVQARFVLATNDAVVLQRNDGARVTVPLARLSARDRGYVEGVAAAMLIAESSAVPGVGRPAQTEPQNVKQTVAPEQPQRTPDTGEAKEIELPDTVGDVALAAAGRLVLLQLPKTKQVAVYDVNESKIVKFLSLSSESARIVGGLTKMIVINPNERVIERWSLDTFKKETTRALPFEGVFKAMALGYASEGPLLILSAQSTDDLARCEYKLFDINTLKAIDHEPIRGRNTSFRDAVHIRAAATGDVFGLWATSHSPQGLEVMRVIGNKVVTAYQHSSAGHLTPNYDGSAILTGYAGVCTPELNQKRGSGKEQRVPLVPTTHPRFYVGVPAAPGAAVNLGNEPFKGVSPTLNSLGSETRLIDLPALQLGKPSDDGSWSVNDFTLDKRVHFIVAANQLVSIPFTNDKLIVQPFDWQAQLKQAAIDYLIVTSMPQRIIAPGDDFRYEVLVVTSGGKPKFELSSGPDGMAVDDAGLVRWQVPRDYNEERTTVILSISTEDGQSAYETFQLECPQAAPVQREKATIPAGGDKRTELPAQRRPAGAPRRPGESGGTVSRVPEDHGREVRITPEPIFKSLQPHLAFSANGPVSNRPLLLREPESPTLARVPRG